MHPTYDAALNNPADEVEERLCRLGSYENAALQALLQLADIRNLVAKELIEDKFSQICERSLRTAEWCMIQSLLVAYRQDRKNYVNQEQLTPKPGEKGREERENSGYQRLDDRTWPHEGEAEEDGDADDEADSSENEAYYRYSRTKKRGQRGGGSKNQSSG